ncbi:IS66-like element accessory protein TnpA [Noviherbaspirillum malthae]|uniref:IS66-like element accessory protein TnpA n=1 Tax=Noviherbaspirillum malthae TaxID=1260987 RepID=UPI00189046B6|nr:transposase [Noviherbaspirillum malthae]
MTETTPTTPRRRRHDPALKAQILAECERPGASIAAVAMAHGINANLVHKWRGRAMQRQRNAVAAPASSFVPVPMPTAGLAPATSALRIELHRGSMTASVSWPLSAVTECAAWLREVLR